MCDFGGVTLARAHAPFLPALGNYANMPRFLYDIRRLCLGCLPEHVVLCRSHSRSIPSRAFFLGSRLISIVIPTSLIMTQTQRDSSAIFGSLRDTSTLFGESSDPLRDSSATSSGIFVRFLFTHAQDGERTLIPLSRCHAHSRSRSFYGTPLFSRPIRMSHRPKKTRHAE